MAQDLHIAVRNLTHDDRESVRALDELTQLAYRGEVWETLSRDQREDLLWTNDIDFAVHLASGLSLAAVSLGRFVGFLLAYREPLRRNSCVYVDGIAVLPSHQHHGVGSAMYRELLKRAKAAQVREIRTRISLDNEISQAFHAAAGFEMTQAIEARIRL